MSFQVSKYAEQKWKRYTWIAAIYMQNDARQ